MTTNEIRQKFLDFFASKGHAVVVSDSLVPKDDPTVLFTTAGMQQFKPQFLGHIDEYTRAATSQKCLRTDDLDEVGQTNFHHTFFEMLGNFSFGDYFKKEAIDWAWEFLTKELKIPAEKLWVSVYKEDDEAEAIWLNEIGISKEKLVKLGDHSNFWPADAKEKGPNGPCGPCSEIFYDYGENKDCSSNVCDPDCGCGRFSEVWNLVFTQYERKEGGLLEPLPNKNIDTGMGLERLVSVIQGKTNNFEIDVFDPILNAIHKIKENGKYKISLKDERIMADHIRAVVFGISDGVVPSNEGRGYVMKRLIVDITDKALQAGITQPTVFRLVDAVVEAMGQAYPEIKEKAKDIAGIIQNIEASYIKVRKERIPELEKRIKDISSLPEDQAAIILGQTMFMYRDTYGLTIPTIKAVVESVSINKALLKKAEDEFQKLMTEQQNQSRSASKMTGDVFVNNILDLEVPKTEFCGYEKMQCVGKVLRFFKNDKSVDEVNEGDHVKVILDKTPFYAESGGQVGDTGELVAGENRIQISDTQKINDVFVHEAIVEKGVFKIGREVTASVDEARRLSIMRNHTATHLLQEALRNVLGSHIQQQGSLVAEDRLRFDFTHHKQITNDQLVKIEQYVNQLILACDTVGIENLPIKEAKKSGALAFFAEKYGNVVRVVSVGGYSKEFCGGTHLKSTGQLGLFKITTEGAVAQGIRRLEAKTGVFALELFTEQERQLMEAARVLKSPVTEVVERIHAQTKKMKQLETEVENIRFEVIKDSLDTIVTDAEELNGIKIVSHVFYDIEMGLLRRVSDIIRKKVESSVIILGARSKENAAILVSVSKDMIQKGIQANELINDVAPLINGSGGGRPQLAQAGSREVQKVSDAVEESKRIIKEKIETVK